MKKNKVLFGCLFAVSGMLYVMNGTYRMLFPIFVLFTVGLLGLLVTHLGGKKLRAEITVSEGIERDMDGQGKIRIKNHSLLPVMHGSLHLGWENTLTKEAGGEVLHFTVLPKGETTLHFQLRAPYCGVYQVKVSRVRIYDVFYLFCARRKTQAEGSFLVYPKIAVIQVPITAPDAYDMESFRYSEVRKGDDASETFSVREYMAGDSIRKIHWKLTGKMDTVMIRESSYPVFRSILLLLESGYQESVLDAASVDAAVSVYLSLAKMLIEQKIPFDIGYFDYGKNRFCTERIESMEVLWIMIPEILQAGRNVSACSAYEQYQLYCGDRQYAHYIYITAENEYQIQAGEQITVLSCGTKYHQSGSAIQFTAGNWEEELA